MADINERAYANHLDELSKQLAAGDITQGMYEVRRTRALAQLGHEEWPKKVKFLLLYSTVMSVLFLIYVLIGIVAALGA